MVIARHEFFTSMLVYKLADACFTALLLMFFAVMFVILTRITGIPTAKTPPITPHARAQATLGILHHGFGQPSAAISSACRNGQRPVVCLGRNAQGEAEKQRGGAWYSIYGAGGGRRDAPYSISLLAACSTPVPADDGPAFGPFHSGRHAGRPDDGAGPGGLMVAVGRWRVKLSAVPFHFWCPQH